jgi:hypothetical protein
MILANPGAYRIIGSEVSLKGNVMLLRNLFISVMMLIGCAAVTPCQEQQKIRINAQGELVISPEMAERARRRRQMLDQPDFLTLKIVAAAAEGAGGREKATEPYRVGDKFRFELFVTSSLTEPFEISVSADQNRPQLLKDGHQVPYHQKAAKFIKDNERLPYLSALTLRLKPGEQQTLGIIDLKDWYEPLAPGLYELTVRHRFQTGGKWIDFPQVTFEVVPE